MKIMTHEELHKHLRDNCEDQYNAMVVVAALYKKLYGSYPKIGLSGQQAEFINELHDSLPDQHLVPA